jgi:hypothetical protein
MKPLVVWLVACAACSHSHVDPPRREAPEPAAPAALTVTSTAFAAGGAIPRDYTCEGKEVAPPLAWSGAPDRTQSFAIVADDPDAPSGTWVHWVVAGIPASVTSLPEGGALPAGAVDGTNSFGKLGWGGPCPPSGTHHYHFKIYALDAGLGGRGMTKAQLLAAMKDHVLARGELVGTYQKGS